MKDFDQLVMATRTQQCHIGLVTTTTSEKVQLDSQPDGYILAKYECLSLLYLTTCVSL